MRVLRVDVWAYGSRWSWHLVTAPGGTVLASGRCETWLQAYRAGYAARARAQRELA